MQPVQSRLTCDRSTPNQVGRSYRVPTTEVEVDPLAQILEAAGIPQARPTRTIAERDGHRVITDQVFDEVQHFWTSTNPVLVRASVHHHRAVLAIDLERWQRSVVKAASSWSSSY